MLVRSVLARWLAAFLLLASPAVGGQVLSLVHPCAVETAERDPHAGHGSGHDQAPSDAHCTCIGSCQVAAFVAVAHPEVVVASVAPLPVAPLRVANSTVVRASDRPIDRLPPPTAPPIA